MPGTLALQHKLADRLVYSKVKDRLGGNLRIGVSGGAPLAKEIIEFFALARHPHPRGLRPHRVHDAARRSTDRRATASASVGPRVCRASSCASQTDGEILIKSDTVFGGYFKDDEATRDVLHDDGWLRSGDVGHLDEDGYLTITDRQEGPPRHRRRQEHRAAESRERAEDVTP